MRHRPPLLIALALCLSAAAAAAEPTFVARTAAGKDVRGALVRLGDDWSCEIDLGKGVRRTIRAGELIGLRQEGVRPPPLPADEHLLLANGDRVPFRDLRLKGEQLTFRHPDLGKETVSVPLSSVVLIWRIAPDRVLSPEKWRRRLAAGTRGKDRVLLRNGDTLEGTLNALDATTVEVELNKKAASAKWAQVAAVALSTELTQRTPPRGAYARLTLTAPTDSAGGRFTLTKAECDGTTFTGRTTFGATVRVPLERVAALDVFGGRAVALSGLAPARYEYRPWLDEKWPWTADATVTGRDLRVGGGTYDRGIGMHGHSLLTWNLGGAYRRFEATVGLDDLDGVRGRVRVRILRDGKATDLGELTHAGGPRAVNLDVEGVKELTLEVAPTGAGPVQAVVNWVGARLVK